MAARDEKIRIEVFGPVGKPITALPGDRQFDESVLRLARLIGRQIAREQFHAARKTVRAGKRRKS